MARKRRHQQSTPLVPAEIVFEKFTGLAESIFQGPLNDFMPQSTDEESELECCLRFATAIILSRDIHLLDFVFSQDKTTVKNYQDIKDDLAKLSDRDIALVDLCYQTLGLQKESSMLEIFDKLDLPRIAVLHFSRCYLIKLSEKPCDCEFCRNLKGYRAEKI